MPIWLHWSSLFEGKIVCHTVGMQMAGEQGPNLYTGVMGTSTDILENLKILLWKKNSLVKVSIL